jgi:hypothetical protein
MTHENLENMLALFPNVKGFGYAYFLDEHEPKYYGMSVIKPAEKAKCLKRIIAMIETYQPSILLLPTPDGKYNRKRKRIQEILEEIREYAGKQDIPVKTYSREQIRLVFEQFDANSKLEIAEKICIWIPELEKYKPAHRKSYMPEDYYQGMFDAISLIVTHSFLEN